MGRATGGGKSGENPVVDLSVTGIHMCIINYWEKHQEQAILYACCITEANSYRS